MYVYGSTFHPYTPECHFNHLDTSFFMMTVYIYVLSIPMLLCIMYNGACLL